MLPSLLNAHRRHVLLHFRHHAVHARNRLALVFCTRCDGSNFCTVPCVHPRHPGSYTHIADATDMSTAQQHVIAAPSSPAAGRFALLFIYYLSSAVPIRTCSDDVATPLIHTHCRPWRRPKAARCNGCRAQTPFGGEAAPYACRPRACMHLTTYHREPGQGGGS